MKTMKFFLLILFSFVSMNAKAQLSIEGEVTKSLKLTVEAFAAMKTTEIKSKDRDGKEHVYKGVLLSDVLVSAGVTLGAQLRGENLAKYVLVKAIDGYEVIFSLPEIDPEFTNNTILVAFQVDGAPLPKGEGPFRMVSPDDKKHARWVREVTSIVVLYSKG